MTTTWKRIRKVDGGFIFSRYTPWSLGVAKTPSHPLAPRKTPISQRHPTTPNDTPSSSAVNGARIRRKPPLPSHRLLSIAETHTPRLTFCNQKQLPPPLPWGGSSAFTSPTPKNFLGVWSVFTGRTPKTEEPPWTSVSGRRGIHTPSHEDIPSIHRGEEERQVERPTGIPRPCAEDRRGCRQGHAHPAGQDQVLPCG